MNLFDQVSEDIKKAMLAREKVRLEALRGAKKEFLEAKTAKGANGELPDDKAIQISSARKAPRYIPTTTGPSSPRMNLPRLPFLRNTFPSSSHPKNWKPTSARLAPRSAQPVRATWAR